MTGEKYGHRVKRAVEQEDPMAFGIRMAECIRRVQGELTVLEGERFRVAGPDRAIVAEALVRIGALARMAYEANEDRP